SMTVWSEIVLVFVTVIVAGPPQSKATFPPPVQLLIGGEPFDRLHPSAASKAASVQLAALPVPTMASAWTNRGEAVVNVRTVPKAGTKRATACHQAMRARTAG